MFLPNVRLRQLVNSERSFTTSDCYLRVVIFISSTTNFTIRHNIKEIWHGNKCRKEQNNDSRERKEGTSSTHPSKDLETVDSFKYLGSKVTTDGKCSEEVRSRLPMASSSLMNLSSIWRNSSISIKTKFRLLTTITRAVALYGCETWTTDAALQKRINALEMKCYK